VSAAVNHAHFTAAMRNICADSVILCPGNPWRENTTNMTSPASSCLFCDADAALFSNDHAFVRFDDFPVNPGHCLIIPHRHFASFFEATPRSGRRSLRWSIWRARG